MQWLEDKAYREADEVLSNLPNAVEHMVERGMDANKFNWIPNGIDLSEVVLKRALPNIVTEQLPEDKFLVGYTGPLGIANALDSLIKAAEILKKDDNVIFVLVGNGKEKAVLMDAVRSLGLHNVVFIDPIKKDQVQSLLAKMDVLYIAAKDEAMYRFGVSPNKLFEYLYSAKPILYAINSRKYLPINEAKAGISIPAENPHAIADAILKLKALSPGQRNKMGQNGHDYALKNHDYEKLAVKLANVLLGEK